MYKLWYQSPARRWREALPIGNGHTGVMLYGGKRTETLCFNDTTLWSGYPKDYNSTDSLGALEEVRSLIFNGRNSEADRLTEEKLSGFYSETFLPLGKVRMRLHGVDAKHYERELDLPTAVHTVKTEGCVREAFASFPDRIVVCRITSSKPFSMTITAKSRLHYELSADGGLNLSGNAPDYAAPNYLRTELRPIHYDEGKGMAFCLRTEIDTDGTVQYRRKKAVVRNAKTVTLYFATATGFRGFDQMPDISRQNAVRQCRQTLAQAPRNYEQLKQRHTADFTALYGRQKLSLRGDSAIPTDQLLKQAKQGGDSRALCELFYHYGKYMILSGSRSGGQPLNLQGIWNNAVRPPWSSNYTVNINTQMNYWGASRANLPECVEPLLDMVWETMQNGKKTARVNYGCEGFACNHNVDIWRKTPPVRGTSNYMFAPLCGVWLANEVYAHYQNGALASRRDQVVEIVTEAARFANDFLVLHDGAYVTCPSASPENAFEHGGKRSQLDYASAFDMGLVRQAFQNYLEISPDNALKDAILQKLPLLYPFKEGKNGICEWHDDYETPEKGHRHFSPLYAFYPASLIGYHADPERTKWINRLFRYRLSNSGQHIGWSAAWAICLAARLHDGETALKVAHGLLAHAVFLNLFCVHPPFLFQIDGNLGFVAGVNEMLLTQENGVIELLPALPEAWKNGSMANLLVNGAQISFVWKNGEVVSLESDQPITVRNSRLAKTLTGSANVTVYSEKYTG